MYSNNKNKNLKELTLEQVIEKSTFRKTIDNLCYNHKNNLTQLTQIGSNLLTKSPLNVFFQQNKTEEKKYDKIINKNSYQSMKQIQNIKQKLIRQDSITARSSQSHKNNLTKLILKEQKRLNQFASIQKANEISKYQKIKHISLQRKLQRKLFSKSKNQNNNDYLHVKGGLNIGLVKPITADSGSLENMNKKICSYEIKKYRTVIDFGILPQSHNNNNNNINNLQENFIQKQKRIQKFHSFMLAKNTIPSLKQRVNKSYSHNKLRNINNNNLQSNNNNLHTNNNNVQKDIQLLKKDNEEIKNVKIKKFQLLLESIQNQNQNNKKIMKKKVYESQIKRLNSQIQNVQQEQNQQKIYQKNDYQMKITQGFKGKKVKINQNKKQKNKFFVPDFIMSNLQLNKINKKSSEELIDRTQNIEEDKKYFIKQINQNKQQADAVKAELIFNGLEGEKCQLNEKKLLSIEIEIENKKKQFQNQSVNNTDEELKKISKLKTWKKNKKQIETELCGWNQDKNLKKINQFYDQVLYEF